MTPARRGGERLQSYIMQDLDEIFGADGPLARALPGFRPRASQRRMAEQVAADAGRARPAAGRGGHRHRQDLRLPDSGAAVGRQGDRLHRHAHAAGPAVRPRHAAAGGACSGASRASRCSRAAAITCAASACCGRRSELQLDGAAAARPAGADPRLVATVTAAAIWRKCPNSPTAIRCARASPPRATAAWAALRRVLALPCVCRAARRGRGGPGGRQSSSAAGGPGAEGGGLRRPAAERPTR